MHTHTHTSPHTEVKEEVLVLVSEQQIPFGISLILTDYLKGSIHVYLFGLLIHKYQEVPLFYHFQGGNLFVLPKDS